jgi:hypothetical protein
MAGLTYDTVMRKIALALPLFMAMLSGCGRGSVAEISLNVTFTPTVKVVQFSTLTPTPVVEATLDADTPTPNTVPTLTSTALPTVTPALLPNDTPVSEVTMPPESTATPVPAAPATASLDFVMRYVRLRNNQENSWDGTLGPGRCGSDHSIYVHVADAQENLLDGVLIGDKYGNFEVPTGVDGPGAVRILVWSATMELAVMGHQDGTRYTSNFTPPLSTVDEDIPLDWLQQSGYCESPEDCRWRVDNNQLCRGHYSYDVIFQRTW